MTPTTPTPDTDRTNDHTDTQRPGWWALAILLAVILASVLALTAGPSGGVVVAQEENNSTLNDTAPYYENETALENQSSWYPDGNNITLDVLGEMSTRLGPYVIGTSTQIPGGNTYSGTVVTGIVMVAIFLGAITFTSIGGTGGIVVAATVGYGLTSVGLAPEWVKIVLLMLIGSIAAIAALRATD